MRNAGFICLAAAAGVLLVLTLRRTPKVESEPKRAPVAVKDTRVTDPKFEKKQILPTPTTTAAPVSPDAAPKPAPSTAPIIILPANRVSPGSAYTIPSADPAAVLAEHLKLTPTQAAAVRESIRLRDVQLAALDEAQRVAQQEAIDAACDTQIRSILTTEQAAEFHSARTIKK